MSTQQLQDLANDFNAHANLARQMLNDPTLTFTDTQNADLIADINVLSVAAGDFATAAAQSAFDDSAAAYTTISTQTKAATEKVKAIKATVAKVDAVISILGAAVTICTDLSTGNPIGAVQAAGTLQGAIAKA
jgi:hypothetical protein